MFATDGRIRTLSRSNSFDFDLTVFDRRNSLESCNLDPFRECGRGDEGGIMCASSEQSVAKDGTVQAWGKAAMSKSPGGVNCSIVSMGVRINKLLESLLTTKGKLRHIFQCSLPRVLQIKLHCTEPCCDAGAAEFRILPLHILEYQILLCRTKSITHRV